MKLNNELLVFDLETTADERQVITQIGCYLLNRDLTTVGSFESYVHQTNVDQKSYLITGIDDNTLKDAPSLETVLIQLEEFINSKVVNPKTVRLAAWGNYFDVNVLRRAYESISRPYPFSGTAIDIKSLAFLWCSLAGYRTDQLSVKKMAEDNLKLPKAPDGYYHNALNDAYVTTEILLRIYKDFSNGLFLSDGSYVKVSK